MQLLIYQKTPFKSNGKYVFSSFSTNCSMDEIKKALTLFSETKKQMGELTRRRIEQISSGIISKNLLINDDKQVSICRGRAGTGKTIGLIQTAIKLVEEQYARVLILTYNKALVSDMRRLFALADLPDMFEINCVHVSTMHSYFYKLVNYMLYDGKLSGDKFINNYSTILHELNTFLDAPDTINLIKSLCADNYQLNWDYLLIDEAQDWSNEERDIVLKLFSEGNIVVADGGNQFVRNINTCNWSEIQNRNNIKLKYCLRQKENIVRFINLYTEKEGIIGGKVLTNGNMPGGKIIIGKSEKIINIHNKEIKSLLDAGNAAYDMLYLVPSSLVKHSYGAVEFSLKEKFEIEGINIWDGTSYSNREGYPINLDEIRLFQYDSARGLEGWTVMCLDFDQFLEEKRSTYVPGKVDMLLLETEEDREKKYLHNWAMIPFTRAIDTLVITLKNSETETYKTLKEIAEKCKDFVSWIE